MKKTILTAITLLLAITLQAQKRVNNRMYNPDPAPVVSGAWTRPPISVCLTGRYFPPPTWSTGRITASC